MHGWILSGVWNVWKTLDPTGQVNVLHAIRLVTIINQVSAISSLCIAHSVQFVWIQFLLAANYKSKFCPRFLICFGICHLCGLKFSFFAPLRVGHIVSTTILIILNIITTTRSSSPDPRCNLRIVSKWAPSQRRPLPLPSLNCLTVFVQNMPRLVRLSKPS